MYIPMPLYMYVFIYICVYMCACFIMLRLSDLYQLTLFANMYVAVFYIFTKPVAIGN